MKVLAKLAFYCFTFIGFLFFLIPFLWTGIDEKWKPNWVNYDNLTLMLTAGFILFVLALKVGKFAVPTKQEERKT